MATDLILSLYRPEKIHIDHKTTVLNELSAHLPQEE
jgi:hypothetical protein